jgi:hypothetical protein
MNRRNFIAGFAAATVAPRIAPRLAEIDLDALVRTIPFLSTKTAFQLLEDARLVLPDTNRFRFLSDGD